MRKVFILLLECCFENVIIDEVGYVLEFEFFIVIVSVLELKKGCLVLVGDVR